MDSWSQETHRHKKPHTEMSNAATLSPSPFNFGDPASSNFLRNYFPPSPSESRRPSFLDRRRTSHPHNPPLHRPDEMSDRSHSSQLPSLQHRASQTIIDLTEEEPEERATSRTHRARSRPPPQLGRSDAVGFGDFVDLTEDNIEPDIIITGGRELPVLPQNAAHYAPPTGRDESPSLFVPPPPTPHISRRVFAAAAHHNGYPIVIRHGELDASIAPIGIHGNFHLGMANHFMDHFHLFRNDHPGQAMPGHMDYQNNAFAPRKPEHVPPPPARQDFTRSPKEDDTIICPSCEEELVHKKGEEQPVSKKGGKAPTRKEREEHPFWVVKECGHVYCNKCFQARTLSGKAQNDASFPEKHKTTAGRGRGTKVLMCAVDDCESEIKSKDRWVGVFL